MINHSYIFCRSATSSDENSVKLYDHCVDDPADPLGFWLAANSADNMKEGLTGKAPTPARDGVAKMAPLVGMTAATGLAAGNLAASAPCAAAIADTGRSRRFSPAPCLPTLSGPRDP